MTGFLKIKTLSPKSGIDAGPGLAQTRDSVETVTDVNRDTRGDAGIAGAVAANALWNNQCAVLAGEDDQNRWAAFAPKIEKWS